MSSAIVRGPPRTDFGPAPPGYIAGAGRGAVGFTTRSDIGPAKPMEESTTQGRSRVLPIPPLPQGYGSRQAVPGVAAQPDKEAEKAKSDAIEAAKYNDSNYDEFSGYGESLFANTEYTNDDREADAIYAAIDRRVASKKRKRGQDIDSSAADELDPLSAASQFAPLKRELAKVSESEWDAIPEPLDYSRRNALLKQQNRTDKLTAVPDALISAASSAIQTVGADRQAAIYSGMTSSIDAGSGIATTAPDLVSVGRARDAMLGMKLDRAADSVSGQTVVDPHGYMTEMSAIKINSTAELSDIKKARRLMQSVIDTNPSMPSGYIGLARLEKDTGNLATARQVIAQGCEACPSNEDVWMEAIMLHPGKASRSVIAQAVKHLPHSINLWLLAARLEESSESKKLVLRRALELIPNSVQLWKAAIQLEDEADARILLQRAVELVPDSVEMWLALARLSNYSDARSVLNRARKAVPGDSSIWVAAAKLEEKHGNVANVRMIVEKAVKSLAALGVRLERDHWLSEAETAEKQGHPVTCAAIVHATVGLGVDPLDQRNTWTADAQTYANKGSLVTARAIHAHLIESFPDKRALWVAAAQFERQHGTRDQLMTLLSSGVERCPHVEILWLMWAKEVWLGGDVAQARSILERAHAALPDSEEIWLAAMKIEFEEREYVRAKQLLSHARRAAASARIFVKSAKLERVLGDHEREFALLEEGLAAFPDAWKLWLMRAQALVKQDKQNEARDTYKAGTRACPTAVDLWIEYAWFEVNSACATTPSSNHATSNGKFAVPTANPVAAALSRARPILEAARVKIPKNDRLWLATIRIEQRASSAALNLLNQFTPITHSSVAAQFLAKALQECPTSGLLWAHAILNEPRPGRRQRSYDALQKCPDSAYVHWAIARLFWLDLKWKKAREWFERAVVADSDLGDVWAFFYRFESEANLAGDVTDDGSNRAEVVLKRCVDADPAHGELWTSVSKDDRYVNLKTRDICVECATRITEILPGERLISKVKSSHVQANGVKSESQSIKQERS